ncbi:MAG: SecE/Sec61-gamma subunit of protein translocation complex [Gaiellales bacterium]|nr:SecE/Sec61-gamma subunit of protein translocation complex [Gaiellales bacterium]
MARGRRQPQPANRRSISAPLAGKPKSQSGGEPTERRGFLKGLRGGVSSVRGELGKVDFPNRQQTWQSTSVVISACIIVGLYLYGLDRVFGALVSELVNLQK